MPKLVIPCSAYLDSDDYEHVIEDDYDSDDYDLLELSVSAPRSASKTPSAASGPPSVSYAADELAQSFYPASSLTTTHFDLKKERKGTRQAISSGFNVFLLFGAAIDRFVWRLQAAGLAAGAAALALTQSILRAVARCLGVVRNKAHSAFRASPAGKKVEQLQRNVSELNSVLPDDTWGKLLWLWDRPPVQRLRLTVSMFNLSFRLPALMALVATQVGLLASQVSLPMLAPLLLGTGMLLRSIKTNASFLFPRIGLLVVMLWLLWFANSVVQNTTAYLRKQGAIDNRLAGGIITVSEVSTLLVALVVLLSMLGVNVSALLLPAGIAVAIAAKDLSHNFLAGFFLFVVQPFKLGDRLAVSSAAGLGSGFGPMGGGAGGWFEGVCEKVDLRYTIVRQGRRRLMVPNSAFLTREFMVLDDGPLPETPVPPPSGGSNLGESPPYPHMHAQQILTNDNRHVWAYVQGPPVHQELATVPQQPAPPPPPETQAGSEGEGTGHAPSSQLPPFTKPGQEPSTQPVSVYAPKGAESSGGMRPLPPPPPGGIYYQATAAPHTTYNSYGQPVMGTPYPGQWQGNSASQWSAVQRGGGEWSSHPMMCESPDAWRHVGSVPAPSPESNKPL